MKITLKNFKGNSAAFMRAHGYAFDKKRGDESSFVRRVAGRAFPRFHAYVREIASPSARNDEKDLLINLHLDQKRPSYDAGPAHGGEYEGELVKDESKRLKAEN